jgi:hypothetical protein
MQTVLAIVQEALGRSRGLPYAKAKALLLSGQAHALSHASQQARDAFSQALGMCMRLGERLYSKLLERALAHSRLGTTAELGMARSEHAEGPVADGGCGAGLIL